MSGIGSISSSVKIETPSTESRQCTKFEAHFGETFLKVDSVIPAQVLRGACRKFNGQLSIQPISLGILFPFISRSAPRAIGLLGIEDADLQPRDAAYGNSEIEDDYVPLAADSRRRLLRQIRARRGQKA